MKTPICDFVETYAKKDPLRFHMPGHKGHPLIGCEAFDITEIEGADVLYSAEGIIEESEQNASSLFKTAHTYFSTEGSSLSIKAMLALVSEGKKKPLILAARNVHKAFIYAAALLDLSVDWLSFPDTHLCECPLTPEAVEQALSHQHYDALYLTSPDYLGQMLDIKGIAAACHKHKVPLLVDNAHGAYLAFLSPSRHPISLGATMCADSAHKTLPTLTGGAYLHIAKDAPSAYIKGARRMLSLFASTSPSYLTLASLDKTNAYLSHVMPEKLSYVLKNMEELRGSLSAKGYVIKDGEPMKLVLCTSQIGYEGKHFASVLRQKNIEPEYVDQEYIVFMCSAETTSEDLQRLEDAVLSIPIKPSLPIFSAAAPLTDSVLSLREAVLSKQERIPASLSEGRICGAPTVSCPPAVPIVISGERITKAHIDLFSRYGIDYIDVIEE